MSWDASPVLKHEYPKAITDLLGIPPVQGLAGPWMSSEGTVLKSWLEAVAEALDLSYVGEKTRTMKAIVEAVGAEWDEASMTSRLSRSAGGGNISSPAFEAVFQALVHRPPAARARFAAGYPGQPFEQRAEPRLADDRLVLRAIRARAGQPQFRANLLVIYGGRCAVTGCDAPAALEAAHVTPYGDGGTYSGQNGLLLRADLHTLFDKGLIAFDHNRRLLLHPSLRRTEYSVLGGTTLRNPEPAEARVPPAALAAHRARSGLYAAVQA